MYQKVNSGMNFAEREKSILEFWKENRIFEQTQQEEEGHPTFTLYDGPPTANGKPHIGHILTRVMKDIIPRYKKMEGYNVTRKAGWDTHGLPVELEVEKMLGIDGKQEIEKYGIEQFVKKCKESVWKYKSEWERMSDRVGYWVDMEHPYVTYDNDYIESEWWSLKQIYEKGLLYQGFKIVPYCPRCGTALSSHEVAQGYKDVKETSAFVKFPVCGEENTYFLAWTTTPWTLPSNVALCVNAKEEYCKVQSEGEHFYLARNLVEKLFEHAVVEETFPGSALEGKTYRPLFDYVSPEEAYRVVCDGYVTLTDGSGIVHIAPAFGEDDARVGKNYGLPFVQLVDERGRFTPEVYDMAGVFCKDGDKLILQKLKEKGLLFRAVPFEHSYPFCWRCDTPLLYYARKSWFIKMTAVKESLRRNSDSVNWIPPSIGPGRMGNFLDNVIDWGISRERYWGTPLPIWICPDCGEIHVVGSRKELRELAGLTQDVELHRPYIDEVTFRCEKCGGTMHRTPEVLDCWYDSGSMPFAQLHYPFENKDVFEKNFPATFISEAVDQTRGWFYTLLAVSTLLFDKAPFRNCIVLGHVNDKNGIKMSKHKGNVVDPWSVLDVQGADAVRWYFYTSSAPWLPSRFYADAVSETQRRFLGTLWNTYAFFVLYAEIDRFDPSKYHLKDCKLSEMDRWILSELNTLVKTVRENLDRYQITESARACEAFVDDLSNWYLRRGRERYWGSGMTEDKQAAYVTLYTVLVTLSKVLAPFVPFISEMIYQNLVPAFYPDAPKSVHLCSYPVCDEAYVLPELEKEMRAVLKVVMLGRAARNAANVKNRQPLGKMFVIGADFPPELQAVVADELNVKQVEFSRDANRFSSYELKPQMRTLGPKYGKLLGAIREFLQNCDAKNVVETVRKGEEYHVELNGTDVALTEADLLISTTNSAGFETASDGGVTVALDTELTPELLCEGLMRELVSKIQTTRKEQGFEVTDHVKITCEGGKMLHEAVERYRDEICADTLCDCLTLADAPNAKEVNLNGETVKLSVEKA